MTSGPDSGAKPAPEPKPSLLPFDPADLVAMRVLPAEFARMVGHQPGSHRDEMGVTLGVTCCLQLPRSLQGMAFRGLLDRRHPNKPSNGVPRRPESPDKSRLPAFFLSHTVHGGH